MQWQLGGVAAMWTQAGALLGALLAPQAAQAGMESLLAWAMLGALEAQGCRLLQQPALGSMGRAAAAPATLAFLQLGQLAAAPPLPLRAALGAEGAGTWPPSPLSQGGLAGAQEALATPLTPMMVVGGGQASVGAAAAAQARL